MILQSVSELRNKPGRVVSLVPSQSELLHFLGLDAETIAITKFCVHPASWFHSKKIIGGTKNINIYTIKNLQPDLIIANKEENVKAQVEELAKYIPVWLTDINNLEDALQMIRDIGLLTKRSDHAEKLVEKIVADFALIKINFTSIPTAYLIWRDPFMTIGGDTFISDMLYRCGLQNVFADKSRYPAVTITELIEKDCRLLLLSSEPYPFQQYHLEELQVLLPNLKIILVNGELFSWYGSRLLYAPGYFTKLMKEINILFDI